MNKLIYNLFLLVLYVVVIFFGYIFVKTCIQDYHDRHDVVEKVDNNYNEDGTISETTNPEDGTQTNEGEKRYKVYDNVSDYEDEAKGFVQKLYNKIIDFFSGRTAEYRDGNDKGFLDKFYDNVIDFFSFNSNKNNNVDEEPVRDNTNTNNNNNNDSYYSDPNEVNNSDYNSGNSTDYNYNSTDYNYNYDSTDYNYNYDSTEYNYNYESTENY